MLMDNERDYFTVAWGVRRAGLRGVPVNWHLTAAEVAYMVDNSDAVALIVSAGLIEVAEEVRASNDRVRICLTNGAATAPSLRCRRRWRRRRPSRSRTRPRAT